MITQTVKRWLRSMFSWWPWKYTPPQTYRQTNTAPSGMNALQEGISRAAIEGTTAQTSLTPRLSTIEERPEHPISAPKSSSDDRAETSLPPSSGLPADSVTEPATSSASPAAPAPTPQQRLEFLRYLVQHGIVNEGQEK